MENEKNVWCWMRNEWWRNETFTRIYLIADFWRNIWEQLQHTFSNFNSCFKFMVKYFGTGLIIRITQILESFLIPKRQKVKQKFYNSTRKTDMIASISRQPGECWSSPIVLADYRNMAPVQTNLVLIITAVINYASWYAL